MYMQVTTAYPGEQFLLGIQALDEIGRSTSDIIRISDLTDRVNGYSPANTFHLHCYYNYGGYNISESR